MLNASMSSLVGLPHWGDIYGSNMDVLIRRPMNLKYYQPFQSGNRTCVSPPLEVADDGSKAWMNCLGSCGLLEVLANEKGFYFFKFSDDEACSNVLEAGPWLFTGRMLILKKWHPRLILTKDAYSNIPVWVKLCNIPHEYWTEEGLSYIASVVGKPLYVDSLTESKKRISFARVCIEIDTTCDLVDSFDLFMGDNKYPKQGEKVEILVEYQWKPKIYTECKSFGHSDVTCPRLKTMQSPSYMDLPSKPKQEWKMVKRGDATSVSTPLEAFEHLPLSGATMKGDEATSRCISEIEPHIHDANVSAQIYNSDPSKENVIDTSNHFSALVDHDGNLGGEDDSPTTASPDHSLWLTKIKNIDRVPIIGLSSPSETSSKKKKKKQLSKAAKKGMESSSQAKVKSSLSLND
ncbi:hypothetical protein Ddye_032303 [Dipteronia dyeriana]|uniref:DUF4283 domain-containing protein n=1 Tax=Dipteronia dyeriana TaxID=168575 RepID=A0AAD9TK51_9ROSI|nr:hypothetical protein Ddye_032303 [Dipteronia dyeriana]